MLQLVTMTSEFCSSSSSVVMVRTKHAFTLNSSATPTSSMSQRSNTTCRRRYIYSQIYGSGDHVVFFARRGTVRAGRFSDAFEHVFAKTTWVANVLFKRCWKDDFQQDNKQGQLPNIYAQRTTSPNVLIQVSPTTSEMQVCGMVWRRAAQKQSPWKCICNGSPH